MFVRKLVEKASKKPAGSSNGLKSNDINPRLVFHYGIPDGSISLAYDSIQKLLAISTKDGRIKLLGKDNSQALLESNEAVPSKFLQFLENQGILLNVTIQNHIEVWNIDRKQLSHVHIFKEEITSFMVIQRSFYMYVGDSLGNISVLKYDTEQCHLVQMKYNIPFSASHGPVTEAPDVTAVMYALPQPMAESKRVLIIFKDGLIILWELKESKVVSVTGGRMLYSSGHELKKVMSACWVCPFGSKVVVGYSTGEIFLWSVPGISNEKIASETNKEELCATQNIPTCKFNLGYKMDKVPIVSLRWASRDGRASCLYVNGAYGFESPNSFQIILMKENMESRIIKLALPLPEACLDMEILPSDQNKHEDSLLLLLKSGRLCIYNNSDIEKYLLQCQSSSPPPLPRQVMVKVPFADPSITVAKYITKNSDLASSMEEDHMLPAKMFPPLLPIDTKEKDGNHSNSTCFSGLAKIKNLLITGHSNGAINFWDASFPYLLLILSVKRQSEDDHSLSGIPVTALYFDFTLRFLVSGDQSGMVRIFKFKPEQGAKGSNLLSLQATTKQGSSHIISSVKLIKVNGSILSISINPGTGQLAVGSEKGYVSIIDLEGPTLLCQKHFLSELYTGIISLQFENCSLDGSQKNVLLVAMKDSSVLALEGETGSTLSSTIVRSKKPSRALLMQILDGQDASDKATRISDCPTILLLCSEKAVRLYSLPHVVQGIKKVLNKKKLHGTCCWASTFYTHSDSGLILLFANGKIEIRSMPDLSLLKETTFRALSFLSSKLSSNTDISLCSSSEGELLAFNGDQEIIFVSLLLQDIYRNLAPISQVYQKNIVTPQGPTFVPTIHKEKKKGIFSTVIKDIKGNKAHHSQDTEVVDSPSMGEELSSIFSTTNFLLETANSDSFAIDKDDVELSIDDINLEDPIDNPRGKKTSIALPPNLNKKFQSIKGKLKTIKVKSGNSSVKDDREDEKAVGAVDQIKKRYGFSLTGESSIPNMAESKLNENLRKLQGISMRTTEMQDTARSFSATAKQLLRTVQQERRNS